jgi:hypothetical protein
VYLNSRRYGKFCNGGNRIVMRAAVIDPARNFSNGGWGDGCSAAVVAT